MTNLSDANPIWCPFWTDEEVMGAMRAIRNAINAWERDGAAEEIDLDSMAEVEARFAQLLDYRRVQRDADSPSR